MIYDAVGAELPIQQGDIFCGLPRVEVSLSDVCVVENDGGIFETDWTQVSKDDEGNSRTVRAILPLRPVDAIVISQNCDAARADYVSLCEIISFSKALKDSQNWSPKTWAKMLTREGTDTLRLFYMPPGDIPGFSEKKAVEFRTVIQLPREDLVSFSHLRKARLNTVAYEHFREKLSQYFRRYPYNPWYPLDKEEFAKYTEKQSETITPYDWQK
ncbi:MAG: hypothetical protein KAH38_09880 [Candidatus Hydrogenedentes bacterium]|nr:hypothetical protein [Candidatus Hydrogenedentota bacterium]